MPPCIIRQPMALFPRPCGTTATHSISWSCCMSHCFRGVSSRPDRWRCYRCRMKKAGMTKSSAWRWGTRCMQLPSLCRTCPRIFRAKLSIFSRPTRGWKGSLCRVLAGPMSRQPTGLWCTHIGPIRSPKQERVLGGQGDPRHAVGGRWRVGHGSGRAVGGGSPCLLKVSIDATARQIVCPVCRQEV